MDAHQRIAAVIPAHNEAEAIGLVVTQLRQLTGAHGQPLFHDIVVCDNDSHDNTGALAAQAGARVVQQDRPGYGAACLTALAALRHPDVVVFVDGDRSVVVDEVPHLLSAIQAGADLVIGVRCPQGRQAGALTPQQQVGNWVATRLIRWLWRHPVSDLGPFRAIRYDCLERLAMQDTTYGWTVEMQVKAIQAGMHVVEVPVTSLRRLGRSKISGTLRGTLGAAYGIIGMILRLWWREVNTRT